MGEKARNPRDHIQGAFGLETDSHTNLTQKQLGTKISAPTERIASTAEPTPSADEEFPHA